MDFHTEGRSLPAKEDFSPRCLLFAESNYGGKGVIFRDSLEDL